MVVWFHSLCVWFACVCVCVQNPSISSWLYEDVRFVSCDFNTQSVDQVLVDAGFKREVKTLFVWEGVS